MIFIADFAENVLALPGTSGRVIKLGRWRNDCQIPVSNEKLETSQLVIFPSYVANCTDSSLAEHQLPYFLELSLQRDLISRRSTMRRLQVDTHARTQLQ